MLIFFLHFSISELPCCYCQPIFTFFRSFPGWIGKIPFSHLMRVVTFPCVVVFDMKSFLSILIFIRFQFDSMLGWLYLSSPFKFVFLEKESVNLVLCNEGSEVI